ncbi:MAG: universal stress protein [Fulvivirga sp.]|nr:universal stress protein [Fulvivirga sp.]
MKKILVPTDFSDEATNASTLAIELAEKSKGEIHFLHLMSIPVDWLQIDDQKAIYPEITTQVEHAKNQLDYWKEQARQLNLTAKSYIHYNESQTGILKYANEENVDLIVMGSKGASGFKEILIGSNTERIVRHAHCPVLVVKEKISFAQIKKIMFPTNLEASQNKIAQVAYQWMNICDAKLTIVRLNTHYHWVDSMKFIEEIDSFAAENGITSYEARTFDADYIEDGIIECAETINCDLIVMGTHNRTGIAHIIAGSVAEDVANHAKRLILTISL